MNPIRQLEALGQSVWLDHLDRKLLRSGELDRMIKEDGVRGVTSNPTIFQKAIASSSGSPDGYDDFLKSADRAESSASVLERLMVRDLTDACDSLRVVYNATDGLDGFASIEVSPGAADDTAQSIEEAQRLWNAVKRPNLMVKIPGTRAGIRAIESCLAHGININITLLFSVARYREVVEAYLRALEKRVRLNQPIDRIASVASFFVSRVDTMVDKRLDEIGEDDPMAQPLRGRIAIANAKIAYEEFEKVFTAGNARWNKLETLGASPQRLLWASTSPKDERYDELHYAEALIGPNTIDTMTRETLKTYLERGKSKHRLTEERDRAHREIASLAQLGIHLDEITNALEEDGVKKFADSYSKALNTIKTARRSAA